MSGKRYTTQEAMKELVILSPNTLRDRARKAGVKPIKGFMEGTEVSINRWTQEMVDEIRKFEDKRPHPSGFTVKRSKPKNKKSSK